MLAALLPLRDEPHGRELTRPVADLGRVRVRGTVRARVRVRVRVGVRVRVRVRVWSAPVNSSGVSPVFCTKSAVETLSGPSIVTE